MIRFLALFLVVASAANALPVTYEFTTDFDHTGSFSFDADTQLGTLDFVVHNVNGSYVYEGSISALASTSDGASLDSLVVGGDYLAWPSVRSAFPEYSRWLYLRIEGADLFVGGELRGDLTYADLTRARLDGGEAYVELYGNTCPTDTPLEDCPRSAFPHGSEYEMTIFLTELHAVPEPEIAASAAAALLLAAVTRRLFPSGNASHSADIHWRPRRDSNARPAA